MVKYVLKPCNLNKGILMFSKNNGSKYQAEMFKISLDDLVDHNHSLVKLAHQFDWNKIAEVCAKFWKQFCEVVQLFGKLFGYMLLRFVERLENSKDKGL